MDSDPMPAVKQAMKVQVDQSRLMEIGRRWSVRYGPQVLGWYTTEGRAIAAKQQRAA